jgi:hypothetical protein
MKMIKYTKAVLLVFTLLFSSYFVIAQRASPAATATGVINGANITIRYSSPGVKGRKIYGTELVPYNAVWRAGANEATIFETDKDITVEGKVLPAGKYSLYAIASEKNWIIIFNSATGQWGINRDGTTTEDLAKDVLRVTVTPRKTTELTERLVYNINKDGVVLSWEYLDVPIAIK